MPDFRFQRARVSVFMGFKYFKVIVLECWTCSKISPPLWISWTLSTHIHKYTGKKRKLLIKEWPDDGHSKHKCSDFSSHAWLTYPCLIFKKGVRLLEQLRERIISSYRLHKASPAQPINTSEHGGGWNNPKLLSYYFFFSLTGLAIDHQHDPLL